MGLRYRLIILIVLAGCSNPKTGENTLTTDKVDTTESTSLTEDSLSFNDSNHENFVKRLNLDTCSRFGSLWGNKIERWEFNVKLESAITNNLFGQVLPKSTLENDKIIINRKELDYFLEIDNIKIQTKGHPISNPDHWESFFGKQIQKIEFDKPLQALIIKNNKLVKLTVNSLTGVMYHTAYPFGEHDISDKRMVPIVYKQENLLELRSPILLVTSRFIEQVNLEKVRINRDTLHFGSGDFPGILYKTGIDFNHDGQNEILMYHEEVQDKIAQEGDESSAYSYSIIAMYAKNKWYRTSYWEEGQDGIEGF